MTHKPKISVIVPCDHAEAFLPACLDKLAAQTLTELEILLVDCGTCDGTAAVIAKYAAKHTNMAALRVKTPSRGLSAARNLALQQAQGEYISFVEAYDTVSEEYCERLYAAAEENAADMVIAGRFHVKQSEDDIVDVTPFFQCDYNESTNIFQTPRLLRQATTLLGSKLYRADVIAAHQLCFDEELPRFEDRLFNAQYLFYAQRVFTLCEPLYYLNVNEKNARTDAFDEDLLFQIPYCEKLVQFFKRRELFEAFQSQLLMMNVGMAGYWGKLRQVSTAKPRRLAFGYAEGMFAVLNTHFPNDWKRAIRNYGTKNTRYKRIAYRYATSKFGLTLRRMAPSWLTSLGFRTLRLSARVYRLLLGLRRYLRYSLIHRHYYNAALDEHAVLLESTRGGNMNSMIGSLLTELSKPEYSRFKLIVAAERGNCKNMRETLRHLQVGDARVVEYLSLDYWKAIYSAKFLVNDHAFPAPFIKKQGQVYLNTWHGYPLKGLGRDNIDTFWAVGNTQRNFLYADYFLCSSRRMADIFEASYEMKNVWDGQFLLAGFPRNDIFFNAEAGQRVREAQGLCGKQLMAYMPTYRGAFHNTPVAVVARQRHMDLLLQHLAELDAALTDEQLLFVNLHPFFKRGIKTDVDYTKYKHIRPFPKGVPTYDFMNACDILITDYSSVMYDFVLTGRKVILFAYDPEEYENQRGTYVTLDELPFARVATAADLLAEINSDKPWDYAALMEECCGAEKGTAARDICQFVFLGKGAPELRNGAHNGRENVLVYGGDLSKNKTTSALLNFYAHIDLEKRNYIHCFNQWHFRKRPLETEIIPEHIPVLAIASEEFAGFREMLALKKAKRRKRLSKQNLALLDKLYQREWQKNFGGIAFSHVLDFDGSDSYNTRLFERFDGTYWANLQNDIAFYDHAHVLAQANEALCYDDDAFGTGTREALEEALASDTKVFVSVGRRSPENGYAQLIDAFSALSENSGEPLKAQPVLVILGGHGKLFHETLAQVQNSRARNHIILLRSMGNPMPLLARCDLIIHGHRDQVELQAASLGLPVLCEDNPEGLLQGMRDFMDGKIKAASIDFNAYNHEINEKFEQLMQ